MYYCVLTFTGLYYHFYKISLLLRNDNEQEGALPAIIIASYQIAYLVFQCYTTTTLDKKNLTSVVTINCL